MCTQPHTHECEKAGNLIETERQMMLQGIMFRAYVAKQNWACVVCRSGRAFVVFQISSTEGGGHDHDCRNEVDQG